MHIHSYHENISSLACCQVTAVTMSATASRGAQPGSAMLCARWMYMSECLPGGDQVIALEFDASAQCVADLSLLDAQCVLGNDCSVMSD